MPSRNGKLAKEPRRCVGRLHASNIERNWEDGIARSWCGALVAWRVAACSICLILYQSYLQFSFVFVFLIDFVDRDFAREMKIRKSIDCSPLHSAAGYSCKHTRKDAYQVRVWRPACEAGASSALRTALRAPRAREAPRAASCFCFPLSRAALHIYLGETTASSSHCS